MKKNILIFGYGYAIQFIDVNNQYTSLFDKDKYHVTVAYLVGEKDEKIRAKHLADEVVFLNLPKKAIRGLKIGAIKQLLKFHQQKDFEIAICHRYKPTYLMLWVSKFKRIPKIISVIHELNTLNTLARKTTLALLAQDNCIFAGVSNAVRDDLRKTLWGIPKERIITLYNMIDVDLTLPKYLDKDTSRRELKLSSDDFIFGNMGRLVANKDQATLIQAFAKIKTQCPNAKLVILGEGNLESELKQLSKNLKVENDVIFTGFIEDGFRFAKAFDVLVSSSKQEAFGRVLLEAMLAKVPVIATSVNGVPEVIDDSGVLIESGNVTLMSDAMFNAYNQDVSARAAWAEKGYNRAKDEFSLQKFKEVFWGPGV